MPSKKSDTTHSVSVDKQTYKLLKAAAEEEDRTISAVVRRLVRYEFEPTDIGQPHQQEAREPAPDEVVA